MRAQLVEERHGDDEFNARVIATECVFVERLDVRGENTWSDTAGCKFVKIFTTPGW